jgi:ankyrin repeat protein
MKKFLIILLFFFMGLLKPCYSDQFLSRDASDYSFSFQLPFNFFNNVPARIRNTDKVDLSFSANNEIVAQYRYRIEVPDPTWTNINKSLLNWSAWSNNAFTDIIILKIDQEGSYRLTIEYKVYGSSDSRRMDKPFEIYNPNFQADTRSATTTASENRNSFSESGVRNDAVQISVKQDYEEILIHALEKKDEDLIMESARNGAGTGIKDVNGGNIFHLMTDNLVNGELITIFSKNGILLNATDNYGNTPLHIAVMSRERKFAGLLIDKGAELNKINNVELSPLHIAAFLNDEELVRRLIKGGADMDLKGNSGYTPLHIAALMNNINVAYELLNSGAENMIKTDQKLTPETIAKIQNNVVMKKLIARNGSLNLNRPDIYKGINISQMNSVKLNPQFEINLSYNEELVRKRNVNRIITYISIPLFAMTSAGTFYLKSEADNYYASYKNAGSVEMAKRYYDKTILYDNYTYGSGGLSLVSAFGIIHSAIRGKNIANKMRKVLY